MERGGRVKLEERFRAQRIFNIHELLSRFGTKGKNVGCTYYAAAFRGQCRKTSVYSPSFNTDPGDAWYNNKCKTFVGKAAISMPEAVAWASSTYGITEWARTPFNRKDMVPKDVMDAAMAWLEQQEAKVDQ